MVAITEKGRRLVEKRGWDRRSTLLPMRVSAEGRTLFEGATLDVSSDGIYFRMPGGESLSVGTRVWVEVSVPAELTGGPLGYRENRGATVVRVENETLASQVGRKPRTCGVALELDAEAPAVAATRRIEPAVVAVA